MTRYDFPFHRDRADDDLRVTLVLSPDRPLPSHVHSGSRIVLADIPTGDLYIAEVLDTNDNYRDGGAGTFVWAELV